eukprot:1158464-Pelagomonas_calceolata.AAC.5
MPPCMGRLGNMPVVSGRGWGGGAANPGGGALLLLMLMLACAPACEHGWAEHRRQHGGALRMGEGVAHGCARALLHRPLSGTAAPQEWAAAGQ